MAHQSQSEFCLRVKDFYPDKFKGDILDIGSLDINGNNRYLFDEPFNYIGIDIGTGKNVDIVSRGHEFQPKKQFDVVISTECFEHDKFWRSTITNAVNLTKSGGIFLFTCATTGRPEHGTERFEAWASPYSHVQFNNHYKNLTEEDIRPLVEGKFATCHFEIVPKISDLYFYGIKK